eukprot:9579768-Prorocentrum_lima.AAC.1
MVSGIGLTGVNVTRLSEVVNFVKTTAKYYIIAGDWNMLPDELEQWGFPSYLRGKVVVPQHACFTAAGGR